jgi:ribosome modulation factor
MHLNKQQRYERALARREGQTAYANGLTLDKNPYDVGTDCHCQWDVGWEEAARSDDKSPGLSLGNNFQNA